MKRLSAGALFKHGVLIYHLIPDSIKAPSERTNCLVSFSISAAIFHEILLNAKVVVLAYVCMLSKSKFAPRGR